MTVAKALLVPQSVETPGEQGHNLSSEVRWSPSQPFSSSLTGENAADLGAGVTEATGRPWTQPIGFIRSLFEVAAGVRARRTRPTPTAGQRRSPRPDLATIVGRVAWDGAKVPEFAAQNVCTTPLVGGRWRQEDGTFELVIVDNSTAPEIPAAGPLEPLA